LTEIVAEPLGPRAVEPRPERRLADHHAAGQRHPLVVVGGAGHHVDVGVDVGHGSPGVRPNGDTTTIQTTPKQRLVVQRARRRLDVIRGDGPRSRLFDGRSSPRIMMANPLPRNPPMIDAETQKPLRIRTYEDAPSLLRVPVEQLEQVRERLNRHSIRYWV